MTPVNQASHTPPPPRNTLQGRTFIPASDAELAEAIDRAFDYRGDVTLTLDDGSVTEGYISNRDARSRAIDFFPRDGGMTHLTYSRIRAVAFSGQDTADGKSWEAWMTKKADHRKAEAERLRQEAIARGEL